MISLQCRGFVSFEGTLELLNNSRKPKGVLDPILEQKKALRGRVAEYLANRRYLENLQVGENIFNPDISRELKDCYENMPVELSLSVSKQHRELLDGLHVCPYCLISEADSKDHYLPKESFPEYAFLVWNLVPCCTNCNRRKGVQWVDQGQRVFFNPFFDTLPDRFLAVDLSISERTVSFYLVEEDGVISSHIKKLGIIERYNDQGSGVFSQVLALIEDFAELQDDQNFREYMAREYRKYSRRFGKNHYSSLIYEELMHIGFRL